MDGMHGDRSALSDVKRALLERRLGRRPQINTIPRYAGGDPAPLSSAQRRFWILEQLEPHNAAYYIAGLCRLIGPLQPELLRRSLNEVVRRHEALRTTFPTPDDELAQVIGPAAELELPCEEVSAASEAEWLDTARRRAEETSRAAIDIRRGPLWRMRLLRHDARDHVLIIVIHHIICDGWSLGVLMREWLTLYRSYAAGQVPALPQLPIRYSDYARWEQARLRSDGLQRQLAWWRERLQALGTLELPTDRPRPPVQTFAGSVHSVPLPAAAVAALKTYAERENATLFIATLAVFKLLLFRLSFQDDIVVGTPIAGRNRSELEGLIGLFINSLVLRTRVSGALSFKELLARVRETALGAYANQDISFEHLVEVLNPERDRSRNPLYQVMFRFNERQSMELPDVPDLQIVPLSMDYDTAQLDLTVSVTDGPWGLGLDISYNTDLFDAGTIERMARHYVSLLERVVADPETQISQLSMLSTAERDLVLYKWNEVTRTDPPTQTLPDLFAAQAARTPDAIALVHGAQRLRYAELNARANRLAHHLRALGVGPDARVALCVDRGPEMVIAILAVLKAGGAYVPLDPAYASERLRYTLQDCQPAVVLVDAVGRQALDQNEDLRSTTTSPGPAVIDLQADALDWADAPDHDPDPRAVGLQPHHLAYIIYTSGSTGRPKGVMVEHANVVRLFSATEEWFHFGDRDVWTLFHSFAFDFSVWEIWGALLHGGQLVIVPLADARSPRDFYRLLCDHGVTVLNQTPSAFQQLIAAQADSPRKHRLRGVIFGGEALELHTLKPWYERNSESDTLLVNMYGITETTVHVTYRPLTASDANRPGPSPIGVRLPDLRLYVLDTHREPAPIGVTGELYVGGAGVARGYLNQPELTAERFVADPFVPGERLYKSGDLARWLPDGTLEYLGRNDSQVKIRGFRIEPGEIEAKLAQHPDVLEVVVLAREDRPGDQRLVAYYTGTAEAEALRAQALAALPAYMVPAAYVKLKALPLTLNGKLDRKALPAPEGGAYVRHGYEAPQGEMEEAMARIWEELLDIDHVRANDGFFDLGGHSLLAIKAVERFERETGIRVAPMELVNQTLRQLVTGIERQRVVAGSMANVVNLEQSRDTGRGRV